MSLKKMGHNDVQKKFFSKQFPELLVTKYKHHFIFYLAKNAAKPAIIGIIHEKRDIVNRLNERLT